MVSIWDAIGDIQKTPQAYAGLLGNQSMGLLAQQTPEQQKVSALKDAFRDMSIWGGAVGKNGSLAEGSEAIRQADQKRINDQLKQFLVMSQIQKNQQPKEKVVGNQLLRANEDGNYDVVHTSPLTPKLPNGYQYSPDGVSLQPIPGGPAEKLTPEQAAKTAQIQNAQSNMPRIRELTENGLSWTGYAAGAGEDGEMKRLTRQAIESYLRATSGAAVPEQEVDRAVDLYMPKPWDKAETRQKKLGELEKFLSGTGANMAKGRGVSPMQTNSPQMPMTGTGIKFLGFE